MKLNKIPFEMIKNGTKTIECRLFDEKRQKIAIGDTIIFHLTDNIDEIITVKVMGLLRYKVFEDMFSRHDPRRFGGVSAQDLTDTLLDIYPLHDQLKNGIVGIDIQG